MDKGLKCVILRPGIICAENNYHWGDKLIAKLAAAVNQIYNTVDGNYTENEFTVRMVHAMNKTLIIPDGNPIRMTYNCNKIRNDLGYRPINKFEETVVQLEEQAQSWFLTHGEPHHK